MHLFTDNILEKIKMKINQNNTNNNNNDNNNNNNNNLMKIDKKKKEEFIKILNYKIIINTNYFIDWKF